MLFYVMFKARYAGLKLTGHLIVAGLYYVFEIKSRKKRTEKIS